MGEIIENLCSLKHRGYGTKNEKKASRIIYDKMKKSGLYPKIGPFYGNEFGFFFYELMIRITMVLGLVISFFSLYFGMALCFIFMWIYATETYNEFPHLDFFMKVKSQNVLAKIKNKNTKKRIVFFAHYDTAKEMKILDSKFAKKFRKINQKLPAVFSGPFFIGNLFNYISLIILFIIFVGVFTPIFYGVLGLTIAINLLMVLVNIKILQSDFVPGASDNASGVEVMIRLIKKFKSNKKADFWFLATGFEEGGRRGALNFLKKHKEEFEDKKTYFINIDDVGSDKLVIVKSEVNENLVYTRYPKEMIKLAEEVNKKTKIKSLFKNIEGLTDGHLFVDKGVPGISIISFDEEWGYKEGYHQKTDTLNKVNLKTIQKATKFAEEFAKALIKSED